MARRIQLLRTLLFSLAVGGALTFGAGTALASPETKRACSDPNANGSCSTWYTCKKICELQGLDPTYSYCVNGCCYCE